MEYLLTPGAETVSGSDRDDYFSGAPGGFDAISCGADADVVELIFSQDFVPPAGVFDGGTGAKRFGRESYDAVWLIADISWGGSYNGDVTLGSVHLDGFEGLIAATAGNLLISTQQLNSFSVVNTSSLGGRIILTGAGGGLDFDELVSGLVDPVAAKVTGAQLTSALILNGTGESDAVEGSRFADTLALGAGNDTASGNNGHDILRGGLGNDSLDGGWGKDQLGGSWGNDRLDGGGGNDRLWSGAGSDTLSGGDGWDRLDGGAGDDVLDGGNGNDTAYGGTGNDSLVASRAYGECGNDDLYAVIQIDSWLDGGAGNDHFAGGAGRDTMIGGAGDDSFSVWANGTLVLGGSGNDDIEFWQSYDYLPGKCTLDGGSGNDSIYSDGTADVIRGGSGNDTITAWQGGDSIDGGAGNDVIYTSIVDPFSYEYVGEVSAGEGNDFVDLNLPGFWYAGQYDPPVIDGGSGWDTLSVGSLPDDIVVTGFEVLDLSIYTSLTISTEHLNQFERITCSGTPHPDAGRQLFFETNGGIVDFGRLVEAGVQVIAQADYRDLAVTYLGTANSDYLIGSSQSDTLSGRNGNDRLKGYAGSDALDGGAGSDTLSGGTGHDTLTGGAGSDVFQISALGGTTRATITDFDPAQDTISLSASAFGLATGPLASGALLDTWAAGTSWISPPAATPATRLIYDITDGTLSFDADGSGPQSAIEFAHLAPYLKLTAADFVVV